MNKILDIDKIKNLTETINKNPIAFVGAVFFLLFWGFFIRSQMRIDAQSEDCEARFERERTEKESLVRALLIKNNIISDLRAEKKLNDSIIKENTIDNTEKLLKYETTN